MKKVLSIIAILLVVLTSCVFTNICNATEDDGIMLINEEYDNMAIPESWRRDTNSEDLEILDQTYFIGQENSRLENAVVNGNVFAFGTNINLNNVIIYGDLFVACQNLNLSNVTLNGTAFMACETNNIYNTEVVGNIFNASETMNFAGMTQDMFAVASNIIINEGAIIAREIYASASSIEFNGGNVGKNVYVSTNELTVSENAFIEGNLNYSSENKANIVASENIGSINFNQIKQEAEEEDKGIVSNTKIYNVVVIAIKSLFVCIFIFLFAKGFMEKQKVSNLPGYLCKNTLKGLGFGIIIPIFAIMLFLTGLAVGLSVSLIGIYCILLWIGVPVVAITIACNLKPSQPYNIWRFLLYTLIISVIIAILKQIPTLGGIVTVIVSLAGLGIILSSLKNKKEIKEEAIVEEK